MGRILRTTQAQLDLVEIGLFVARQDAAAANRLLDQIDQQCRQLAGFPELGRKREELAPDLRSIPVGNYVIFYRATRDSIQVIRILHGARDIPRLFE